nr:hypothetical protein [Desulfuromonadales bacterium]NIR33531.1 hypothetical protein [Desulfuromonadales bacterium]NIS43545.1 hypothetical protein [Desulfuromonadales bacterium]
TVILSSHDPVQPQRLNSEVIRLHGGRVIEAPPVCNNVLPLPALPVIGKTACAGC